MFSRSQTTPGASPKAGKSGAPGLSFIGPETVIGGDVATSAQLHVDGRIDGNVRCGQLCQGAGGVIAGDIHADEARIAGRIEGTVDAKVVVVEASAKIAGDVSYETISIAAGARIDGRLARREALSGGAGAEPAVLIASPAPEPKAAEDGLFRAEPKRLAAGGR